jgi:hypothetical protein
MLIFFNPLSINCDIIAMITLTSEENDPKKETTKRADAIKRIVKTKQGERMCNKDKKYVRN